MSGFYGADTAQLRDHSALLRDRARTIESLRARLQPVVMDESAWQGADAEAFRADWSAKAAPMFDRVAAQVLRHSDDLDRHADQQDEASGAGTDGVGDGGSWWDGFTDTVSDVAGVYNDLQSLWSHGRKIQNIFDTISASWHDINGTTTIRGFFDELGKYGDRISEIVFDPKTAYSGIAERIASTLGVPTEFGDRKFFGWVDNLAGDVGKVAPFIDDVAPFVGKALPFVDVAFGTKQMIDGIQSGDTFSAVTGGASALGGGLMIAGGALSATGIGAVIGGPMVAAGAIISGGAALADVGRMVYENWDSISSTASDVWNATTDFVGDSAGAVVDTAGDVIDSVSDGFSDAVDGLADAMPW